MNKPYIDYLAWVQGRNYILTHSDACLIINPYCPETEPDLSSSWNNGYDEIWLDLWEKDLLSEKFWDVQGTLF